MAAVQVAVRWWQALQARDWAAARDLVADDARLDWPCSGEWFLGGEALVTVNREYPEGWTISVLDQGAMVDGRVWVVARVDQDGRAFFCNQVATVEEGRLRDVVEYWASFEDPPPWRAGLPGRHTT